VKGFTWTAAEIRQSRVEALGKVREYLDNFSHWSQELPKLHGQTCEQILISARRNSKNLASEFNLELSSELYTRFTGSVCYTATKNLLVVKQHDSFRSYEQGLIAYGLKLCTSKEELAEFFRKYAAPYNERVKNSKASN
jgi:hypothetical protein